MPPIRPKDDWNEVKNQKALVGLFLLRSMGGSSYDQETNLPGIGAEH
jgi:hypothetical protein